MTKIRGGRLQVLLTRSLIASQHSSEDIEKLRHKDEKHLSITHQAAVRGRNPSNPPKSNIKKADKKL